MIKILYVINDFEKVSLNNVVYQLAKALDGKKFSVYVYSLKSKGSLKFLFENTANISTYYGNGGVVFPHFKDITKIIIDKDIDLVHTQTLRSDYVVFLARIMVGFKRRIIHFGIRQNFMFLPNESSIFFIKNVLFYFSCHLVTHNICAAKHLEHKLIKTLRVSSMKVSLIQNGLLIDPKRVQLNKEQKTNLRLNNKIPAIAYVGQIISRKNVEVLVQALTNISRNYRCLIIGSGREEQVVRNFIRDKALDDKIFVLGFRSDIRPYLTATDIFVMPSMSEGLTFAVIEAMAYGIPCIVSNISAHSEMVTNNKNGLLFELGTNRVLNLTKKLNKLLSDTKLRRRLGGHAKKTIISNHTKEKMVKGYKEIYQHHAKNYLKVSS